MSPAQAATGADRSPSARVAAAVSGHTTGGGTVARARVQYLSEAEKAFIHEKTMQVLRDGRRRLQHAARRRPARRSWRAGRPRAAHGALRLGARRTVPEDGAARDPARRSRPVPGPRPRSRPARRHQRRYVHLRARRPHRREARGDAGRPRALHPPRRRTARDRHPLALAADFGRRRPHDAARHAGNVPAQHEQAHPGRDPLAEAGRADPRHVRGGERRVAAASGRSSR